MFLTTLSELLVQLYVTPAPYLPSLALHCFAAIQFSFLLALGAEQSMGRADGD